MLLELGRGPIEMRLITIETALDEESFDLPRGSRGFLVKDRLGSAVLRWSNVKGEVAKASTADPKPKFWTVRTEPYSGMLGIRVMEPDAEAIPGEAKGEQPDGTVLEQRFYVTSETGSTDIEVIIVPGT